jgi:excinuclease ABC subunit C
MPPSPTIAAKLRELPDSPGVYQMKDRRGRIIYIGKALSLKNRVPTYFHDSARHDPRISHLVRRIEDVDWIVVPSELDALMLESSLVRQWQPMYNTMLKDDKSYPYVKITSEPFPRVMLTRRYVNDGGRYWGPMTSVSQVRSAVRFIAGLFQLRTCKLEIDGEKKYQKPCLDYHLKLCSAPCVEYINREDYATLVGYAQDFFNGNYGRVVAEVKQRMWQASEARQYEAAARYRDLIAAAEKSVARQRVIGKPGENLDVVGLAHSRDKACVLLMPVRDGRLIGDRKFILNQRMEDAAGNDVLSGFIKLHYANPLNVPPEIVLPREPAEAQLLATWLGRLRGQAEAGIEAMKTEPPRSGDVPVAEQPVGTSPAPTKDGSRDFSRGEEDPATEVAATDREGNSSRPPFRRVSFTYPQRVHKADLLKLALKNAEERLHTELLGVQEDFVITPGQRALAGHLGLAEPPRRVEGYDIANIQGQQATGAMVVFTGGRKDSAEYRLFNIRLKQTPDDYAMLQETLRRRLIRLMTDGKWDREVDVVMIDGGKGQLSAVRQVFDELSDSPDYSSEQKEKFEGIKLVSLAKQEELVYHYGEEDAVEELRLERTDPGLQLLVKLRDEAHRYGNAQHQKMRDKVMRASVLDTIPGLGDARKTALLKHFGSVKRLREADEEELAEVPGIGVHMAAHIRKCLDRDEQLEELKDVKKREMIIKRHGRRSRG